METTPVDEHELRGLWAVEESLGHRFRDKSLLLAALTHPSFCNEENSPAGDYDELEWLGDSILQLAVTSWLFRSAKGSRRTAGPLSTTRSQFVHTGACESFALQLGLLPFLRVGQNQPVRGTKILADCFEAVLGAVYVDGGYADLDPVHDILARVIPAYDGGKASRPSPRSYRPPPIHEQPLPSQRPPTPSYVAQRRSSISGEEPRKLMNLAHRLVQIAKRAGDVEHAESGALKQSNVLEVLQEFDGRLGALQNVSLSGGRLSYTTPTFAATFGGDVAQFFKTIAENHKLHGRLDAVLKGNLMLRNCLPDAPPSADRVVMEVVPTPVELRLERFTAVEFLMENILHQAGPPHHSALRLIESTPNGARTISLLNEIVAESASNLVFSSRQRAVIASGLVSPVTPSSPAPVHAPGAHPLSPPPPGPIGNGHFHTAFPVDVLCEHKRLRAEGPPPPEIANGARHWGGFRGQGRGRGGGREGWRGGGREGFGRRPHRRGRC